MVSSSERTACGEVTWVQKVLEAAFEATWLVSAASGSRTITLR